MPRAVIGLSATLVSLAVGFAILAAPPAPRTDKLGSKIEHLTLRDADGNNLPAPDAVATVVVFLSFECPVSNNYASTLSNLAKDYGPKGVTFAAVSTGDASAAEIAKKASEFRLGFPIVRDDGFRLTVALQAATTPEAFVLDRHDILRYRGRIDDGYTDRLKQNRSVKSHDLQNALDDLLAGKPVREPATVAVGCPIQRDEPRTASDAKITYYRDVLPVLQANCQSCHRPGAAGPFSLMTYKQAVNWAGDIKDYTHSRKMPPWKPAEGLDFTGERKLSDNDVATLAAWADAGAPAGDPKDAPPPVQFTEGWALGPPDLIVTVPEEFQVGAGGRDLFRVFVLPTGLTEDKYVSAFQVRPGNPRVVHHTLNFIDTTGAARALEQKERDRNKEADEPDAGPGYSVAMGTGIRPTGAIGGWAPGQMPHVLPDGVGYYLPKHSDIVVQVHYHRTGKVEKDQTSIGFYFAKKPVTQTMQSLPAGMAPALRLLMFAIPPNDERFEVKRSLWVTQDCNLHSVLPHMHLLGRQIAVTMTPPDGPTTTLVAIKDWDYNWQETYYFKEPIRVKAGTRFDVTAVYDNSRKNPNNPFDPPQTVRFGEQTTNEMIFGFLGVTGDRPGRVRYSIERPDPPPPAPRGDRP
jgi:AhpC/TSA family